MNESSTIVKALIKRLATLSDPKLNGSRNNAPVK